MRIMLKDIGCAILFVFAVLFVVAAAASLLAPLMALDHMVGGGTWVSFGLLAKILTIYGVILYIGIAGLCVLIWYDQAVERVKRQKRRERERQHRD